MVKIPSDNIWVVVARESYFLLRPKIELFGNGSAPLKSAIKSILPFCGILLQLLVWIVAGFLAGVCLE